MTRRRSAGLTLVEVVVALAVLSLVVLTLGATLRGLAQSSERVDRQVDAIDELRVTSSFLREVMARATPVRQAGPDQRLLFEAAADHLSWVSVMPARFGAAGRFAFRLAVEPQADSSSALVLRYAPWTSQATGFPDWATAESRVLAVHVQRLTMAYLGRGATAGWQAGWTSAASLPARIRLNLSTDAGAWPMLVLPVRTPATESTLFTIGGGTS